jgi:hypothetical protein
MMRGVELNGARLRVIVRALELAATDAPGD